ncbi:MAG: SAM-dependent methyltransferase [Hyphomicrobium sp.]|uniref:class I SAM-dependent methyltransferase n=1 Tax=Hyphomicrobium sp. TaxID=82 RepID=UPI0039E3BFF3
MAEATIENVSDTAFWVAHYRGVETRRPDALFRDPLAAVLAGDHGRRIAESMPRPFITSWVIAVRTRIIDELIQNAVAQGVDTVLNLGSGLDTRPYRMDLPASFNWIEADYPEMIGYKERHLTHETPRFKLRRVTADLADPAQRRDVLQSANAQASKMLVLTEGLVPYLSNDDVGALAGELHALPRAAYWIVDYFSPELLKYRERMLAGRTKNAPFKFDPGDWFRFFEQHGWRSRDVRYLSPESARLGRRIELPMLGRLAIAARWLLSSQERRIGSQKSAGYVLLEPVRKH